MSSEHSSPCSAIWPHVCMRVSHYWDRPVRADFTLLAHCLLQTNYNIMLWSAFGILCESGLMSEFELFFSWCLLCARNVATWLWRKKTKQKKPPAVWSFSGWVALGSEAGSHNYPHTCRNGSLVMLREPTWQHAVIFLQSLSGSVNYSHGAGCVVHSVPDPFSFFCDNLEEP